jgi:type IV secretion system protein TrbI
MTENVFTPHTEPQTEPTLRRNLELPKGVLQKNLKTFVYLGAVLIVIVAALFSSSGKKTPGQQASAKGQPPQPALQDNTDSNVQELKNQLQAERQKEQQGTMAGAALGDSALASATPQPRPMDRTELPFPAFRASPARKRSRATRRCNSRLCNSRHS